MILDGKIVIYHNDMMVAKTNTNNYQVYTCLLIIAKTPLLHFTTTCLLAPSRSSLS